MSDYLKRAFRAQLTTTMDTLLRRAVFEIMTVFENSIHDHQMELAHKGEEVVQLKIKLQTAELKLRERECGGDGAVEIDKTYVNETRRQPEAIQNTPAQTSDVPEIDFEVPDDWCAPLGCEAVVKKNEEGCPSVRLRPLSIALWHVPIKQEVETYHIDSHQEIKDLRRSKRGSSSNKKQKNTQDQRLTLCEKKSSDKKLLQEIKQQYSDGLGLRRGRTFTGNERQKKGKTKRQDRKMADIKLTKLDTEKNEDKKTYSCKFCKKVFDTAFGRTVHVRSHKTCLGCKKEFPFPSSLKCHKSYCEKLKKLLAKRAQHANAKEDKNASPSNKNVSIKHEPSTDSRNHIKSSIQNDAFNKLHSCTYCQKKFTLQRKLKKHMARHTVEKSFTCSRCPKQFHIIKALRSHMTKMHKDQLNLSETNRDLAWTKPLEDTEMKKFPSQASYNKPVPVCQKKCPHVCRDCGKGFFYRGSLANHMQRFHS